MTKEYKHWAVKESWWNGSVTTACGLVFASGEATSAPWFTAKCPTCEQVRQQSR